MWKIIILILLVSCTIIDNKVVRRVDSAVKLRKDLGSYNYELIQTGSGVVIKGSVANNYTKNEIEKIVKDETGMDISSELVVTGLASSSEVANDVTKSFKKLVLGEYKIQVATEGSKVILNGTCDNEVDEEKIVKAASKVPGVTGVESNLKYTGISSDKQLKDLILSRLNALDGIDTSTVNVTVENRVVILSGSQRTRREVDMILSNLQMVPGARDIKSKIKVGNQEYMSPEYSKSNLNL